MSLTASPPRQQIVDKINSYLQTTGNITAVEHKEIELLLVDAIYGAQIGDIKELAVTNAYITDNFDMTGLSPGLGRATKPDGTPGERYGWAICNGLNGTVDKGGRVGVGYNPADGDFSTLGYTSGTKTVTLQESQMPIHNHGYTGRNGTGWPRDSADTISGSEGDSGWYRSYVRNTKIENKGGGQAHNNMQPYIVTLFIQRIS